MAEYDLMAYDHDMFQDRGDVTDLHAYYMTQFNLELENGKGKPKSDGFKFGIEESFDFEVVDNWNGWNCNTKTDFDIIDEVIDNNVSEQNIKEVLLDLDTIEFDDNSFKSASCEGSKRSEANYETNDYIDDECLIDELCREEGESCRLTPDVFSDDCTNILNNDTQLPSIETAFSKRYGAFNNLDSYNTQNAYEANPSQNTNTPTVSSLEHYSYPNNILHNLDNPKNYELPDTPTSCQDFNFDRNIRKVSISDSIESDVQSAGYYDDNSENLDEDDLFINLDDFGIAFETENEGNNCEKSHHAEKRNDKDKTQGERVCLWEHCFERYPNQNTLVEHIERAHVNTYKGDEFSCLWRDCARGRRPFNARYKLLIHMRVHSGHKPNRCHHPGCGKAFSRLENLKIHVRSHTGERPYACPAPHCRKAFSNSSDRAKHQRTHFNARPYACGAAGCNKRYTDPSSLRKHVKSHPHAPPRARLPPARPPPHEEQLVPSSPAKLDTLRCIRDKLTVPRLRNM
ncbi:histone-lysine N-methyltransferase PRDM9-like [Danaus plexippus]|nr:histone-lysine N-methyltransferase PRDM9-like [Danaus plexippus]